jgi:aldose 1-epimerase
MASFPLAPFANRIARARFQFRGDAIALPATSGFEPHALHGVAWRSTWTAVEIDDASAVLVLTCAPSPQWPWRWTLSHHIELSPSGVELGLSMTNLGETVMPAGLGLHPYFVVEPDTVLTLPASRVWLTGDDEIPHRLAPAAAVFDWSSGKTIASAPFIDNAYTDWSGGAHLDFADRTVEIVASPSARWAQIYAPGGPELHDRAFVCLEPVTHRPDAHNAPLGEDAGLVALGQGETLDLTMAISARARKVASPSQHFNDAVKV